MAGTRFAVSENNPVADNVVVVDAPAAGMVIAGNAPRVGMP